MSYSAEDGRARARQVPVRGRRGAGGANADGQPDGTLSVACTERIGEPDGRDSLGPDHGGGRERVPGRERSAKTDRPLREPGADARTVTPSGRVGGVSPQP